MKLPIFIFAFFLISCGGKHIQFDGAVVDSAGNPVENAEVTLFGSQGSSSQDVGLGNDQTDANGVFVFRLKEGFANRHVERVVAVHPNGRIKSNTVDVSSSGESGIVLTFN